MPFVQQNLDRQFYTEQNDNFPTKLYVVAVNVAHSQGSRFQIWVFQFGPNSGSKASVDGANVPSRLGPVLGLTTLVFRPKPAQTGTPKLKIGIPENLVGTPYERNRKRRTGRRLGPRPLPTRGTFCLTNIRASGAGDLPGRRARGGGEGPTWAPSSSSWRSARPSQVYMLVVPLWHCGRCAEGVRTLYLKNKIGLAVD